MSLPPLQLSRQMGNKKYLSEKSVLEIWAARPDPKGPSSTYTAISRALADKFNISTKTVQKVWNRVSWAKITDRAPAITQSESRLSITDPEINTGIAADALSQLGAGMNPARTPPPAASSALLHPPQPLAYSLDASHHLSAVLASNAATQGCLLPSSEGEAGMNPGPDYSLLSPSSSLLSPPLSCYLSHHLSPFDSSTANSAKQDKSLLDPTYAQASVDITHSNTNEPLSSLAESNWMPDDDRAVPAGGRSRRVDSACFHCKARNRQCDGRQSCGRCCRQDLNSDFFPHALHPSASLHGGGASARSTRDISPEHPIPFPSGIITGEAYVVPSMGPDSPWPHSLVRMFKAFRMADDVYGRMLRRMPPKLLGTMMRIFGAMDGAFVATREPPAAPTAWSETAAWEDSRRCGMMAVRMDSSALVMTGVDANTFWTDLAGLHKEEFISRSFSGEMNIPTSELRQYCKLVTGTKELIKLKLAQLSNPNATLEMKPVYGRFSRNWGRGGPTDGVMTRITVSSAGKKQESSWMCITQSMVVVSPEEYDAVRARNPELCEGYLIPVVGAKSAAELMDQRLLVEESLNSHAEGRAQLDRLADVIAEEFRFMFDFFAQRRSADSHAAAS